MVGLGYRFRLLLVVWVWFVVSSVVGWVNCGRLLASWLLVAVYGCFGFGFGFRYCALAVLVSCGVGIIYLSGVGLLFWLYVGFWLLADETGGLRW